MVNLLGLTPTTAKSLKQRLHELKQFEWINLHWYEKEKELPGRKLGHATVLLRETEYSARREEANHALKIIRSIWPATDHVLV